MNKKVLLVDDEINVLNAYKRNLHSKYNLLFAQRGRAGLEILEKDGPVAVVISDYRMPEMDGITFLSEVKKVSPSTVRIMLTGYADIDAAIDTINKGNVFRFLTKPCSNEILTKAINDGIEQHNLITLEKDLFEKTLKGLIKILIDILSIVNPLAFSKAARLRGIIKKIGKSQEESMQWKLEITALLSQIGCIALPGEILEKKNNNDTLSLKEKQLLLGHPQIGKSLLENIPRLEDIAEAIAYQYRRYEEKSDDENQNSDVPVLARLLKHAVDLDVLIEAEKRNKNALQGFAVEKELPSDIIENVIDVPDWTANYVRVNRLVTSLESGMILAQDIIDKNGLVLVSRGTEISEVLIARLVNFSSLRRITDIVSVYIPKQEEVKSK